MAKIGFKIIVVYWKDGSSTTMTVHESTNVLAAYEPVLWNIAQITESVFDRNTFDNQTYVTTTEIYSDEKE